MTASAKWRENGEEDPHGDRYNCERADLADGHLTDDELANAQYMVAGDIRLQAAVKDRIRWLSRRLALYEN